MRHRFIWAKIEKILVSSQLLDWFGDNAEFGREILMVALCLPAYWPRAKFTLLTLLKAFPSLTSQF